MGEKRAEPRVSIGLPVYNGEDFLPRTLDAILTQTFSDFELIISDNASRDRTEEICRDYAAREPRIRYSRNERNLGAAPNYDYTFKLARGEYFKWATHDDLIAPEFLTKCVGALDANPDAILCQSLVEFIDVDGRNLGVYDSRLLGVDASRPSTRFGAVVLRPHGCTEFFGVIRRQRLVGTLLHGNFHGSDRALLAELALRGHFVQVREPLFMMREHPLRYTRAALAPRERQAWHDTALASKLHFPTWRLYLEYGRMVRRNVNDRSERLRCYGHLVKWWAVNWNSVRMVVDLLAVAHPGIVGRAQRIKQTMFSPEPGRGLAVGRKA